MRNTIALMFTSHVPSHPSCNSGVRFGSREYTRCIPRDFRTHVSWEPSRFYFFFFSFKKDFRRSASFVSENFSGDCIRGFCTDKYSRGIANRYFTFNFTMRSTYRRSIRVPHVHNDRILIRMRLRFVARYAQQIPIRFSTIVFQISRS